MKRTLTLILIFSTISVFSQNHYLGISAGVHNSKNSLNTSISEDYGQAFSGGFSYEYRMKKHFHICTNIKYSQQAFSTPSLIFPDKYGNVILDKNFDFKFDYISLQILGGFNFGKKLYGITNFGIVPSLMTSAKNSYNYLDINETVNVMDKFPKLNYSALLEIGWGYEFKNSLTVVSFLSYQHTLTSSTKSEFRVTHSVTTLSIGLKYALKNNK
ncbi:MAG: PorT family protein [Saprospiraceae bacterium]|nr:PorT family protein [Saprospiraceae bacterium]